MSAIPWILIAVAVLLVLLLVIVIIMKKGKKHKTDYYSFFVIGIIWLPMGIVFRIFFRENPMGILFIALGAMYVLIGLIHKDKWKTHHKTWKQLSKKEQRLRIIVTILLGILVLLGLAAYAFLR